MFCDLLNSEKNSKKRRVFSLNFLKNDYCELVQTNLSVIALAFDRMSSLE